MQAGGLFLKRFKGKSGGIVLSIAILLLLVLVVYPLAKILYQSFVFDAQLSLKNYIKALSEKGNYLIFLHSMEISLFSAVLSTLIGTLLAWVVARTDLPYVHLFRTAFVLPFVIPPFIGALAWRQLLGPVGYLNKLYMYITGATEPLWNMYGADGIVAVMVLHLFPLVYITVLGGLERMNPELEEAAQASGSPVFTVMRQITLPLMLPTIASSAVLVFIASIANFGIPAILGFPENYFVLTTRIYEAITRSAEPNSLSLAASLSVLLSLVAGSGLLLQGLYLKRKEYTVLSGKSMQPNIVRLRQHRTWVFLVCVAMVLITSIAPLVAILLTALTRAYGLAPVPANWTLQNFYDVLFINPSAQRAIRNSLLLALGAATVVSLLGSIIAYIIVKTKLRWRYLLDFVSNMPYALPGTVVAVAMILAWLKPIPFLDVSLYNTVWILLVAYIAHYLAFGVRTTTGSLAQIHPSLEEVARNSGASWLQTFRDVVIPLIRPGLFAGWFMVFMPCLRELTISILLWSAGNETIGVMVFNLQESGNTVASAALSVTMIVFLMAANFVVRKATGGRLGY